MEISRTTENIILPGNRYFFAYSLFVQPMRMCSCISELRTDPSNRWDSDILSF